MFTLITFVFANTHGQRYGLQLFQRHRDFFVGHLETSSRATATEKENRCSSRDVNACTEGLPCGSDLTSAQRISEPHSNATVGTSSPRDLAADVIDPEASATIEHLNQMLVTAKASVAKAMWQEEAYRVYVRNRDRVLMRVLQQAGPGEPLSPETVQLLLGTLHDGNE